MADGRVMVALTKGPVVEVELADGRVMVALMKELVVEVELADGRVMVAFMKGFEPAADGEILAFMEGSVADVELATGAGITVEMASGIEEVIVFLGGANPSATTAFGLISLANIKERVFCVTSYLSLILLNSSLISLHTVS